MDTKGGHGGHHRHCGRFAVLRARSLGLVVPTSTHMKALSSAAYAASKAGKAAADAAKQVDDKYGVKDKIKGRIVEFLSYSFEHQREHGIDTVFAAGHSHQILELMTRLTKTSEDLSVKKLDNGNGAKITITKRAGRDGKSFGDYIIEGIEYIDPH